MAVCLDDVLENAITEQTNEVELLHSIYADNFHWIQEYDKDNGSRIEFNLTLSVRHPHEKISVEAVIPLQVDETINQSNLDEESTSENDERQVLNDCGHETSDKDNNKLDYDNENDESHEDLDPPEQRKKPGLSRLLSTKHLHIKSDVSELTPMNVWFRLPPLYPSEAPPQIILSCDWLSTSQIEQLSQELQKLWQENFGDPIIFTWAEWLQNSSWDFLQLPSHLVLREGFKECLFNDGITDVALEMSLLNIFEYDLEIKRREFYKCAHTCEICYEEKQGKEFCFLDECRHFCCLECLKIHSEMHVKTGSVMQLLCPISECDVTIPPHVLKDILEEQVYTRWEQLLLSKALDMMPDIFYCPRCNTAVVAEDDAESTKLGRCASCYFTFCTECQGPWHHGKSCLGEEEEEDDEMANHKKKKSKKTKPVKSKNVISTKAETSNKTFIALMRRKGSYQNCPKCRMVVEKISGCNFMTCSQCRSNFCWHCGKTISSYNHFSSSPKCAWYGAAPPQPVYVREQEPTQGEIIMQQFVEDNPGKKVLTKSCPTCSQKNIKVAKNNFMKCWSCKTRFCYQCGKRLEGPCNKHYMAPNKCTQHSDD